MKKIKEYIGILIFFVVIMFFLIFQNYNIYLKITKERATVSTFMESGKENAYSSSDYIKNLLKYNELEIVRISEGEKSVILAQVEIKGDVFKAGEIFNEVNNISGTKAIKNINISKDNNGTIIKADIYYLSNNICK